MDTTNHCSSPVLTCSFAIPLSPIRVEYQVCTVVAMARKEHSLFSSKNSQQSVHCNLLL